MRMYSLLARLFPNLRSGAYSITSPRDANYNCVAWAAEDDRRWWWPVPAGTGGGNFWPASIPRECTLERFEQAFGLRGYHVCESTDHEPGVEKVAIYVNSRGVPTHTARQLSNGRWTSKLGRLVDIEHVRPEDVGGSTGSAYGDVALVLCRSTERRLEPDTG
jgi:hypothetical protein